jgi:hypothetical protein
MTDITTLIKLAGECVAPFSIGFARLQSDGEREDALPAGSGALVSVGSVHGILTAAHVLEALPDQGEVGLIRFTKSPVIQNMTIEMSLLDKLMFRPHSSEVDGPDLGFLRLTSSMVATLNASTGIFYSLLKREKSVFSNPEPGKEYSRVLLESSASGPSSHRRKGLIR